MNWRARLIAAFAIAAGAGCATILGIDDGTPRDGAVLTDAGFDATTDAAKDVSAPDASDASDAGIPLCDPDAAFQVPSAFSTLDTAANDEHLRLTPNELIGYFESSRDGGLGGFDIYTAQRTSIGDTWSSVTAVATVNTATNDVDPTISADQLTLYLSHASGIMRATRTSIANPFGAPVAVTELNSALNEFAPYLVEDGTALYFSSTRNSDAGVSELFVAQPVSDGGFTAPALVNGASLKSGDNRFAAVTADQLVLYFASNRSGGQGGYDIWMATRASTSVAFGTPHVVSEVSSASDELPSWVSSDRCRLYFTSNRAVAGDENLFVATKLP